MNEASGQPQIKLIDDRNAGMPPGLCGRPVLGLFIAGAARHRQGRRSMVGCVRGPLRLEATTGRRWAAIAAQTKEAAQLRRPYLLYGSTGVPHEAQKKSKPFFSWITLKPAGALSTRVINQSSSTAESWASPVFRQIGHRRISTQWSRSIHNMRPDPQVFQPGSLPRSN
jgi:hypothetical protein